MRKLTYLQSIGYNVSWASFGIIEVMSQARFDHKKIGYLAANQVSECVSECVSNAVCESVAIRVGSD